MRITGIEQREREKQRERERREISVNEVCRRDSAAVERSCFSIL